MLSEMLLNSDSIIDPLLCVPSKGSPTLFFRASHRKPRHCQVLYPDPSFYSGTSPLEQIPPHPHGLGCIYHLQKTPKANGTKHWVILCRLLHLSEPKGASHQVRVGNHLLKGRLSGAREGESITNHSSWYGQTVDIWTARFSYHSHSHQSEQYRTRGGRRLLFLC